MSKASISEFWISTKPTSNDWKTSLLRKLFNYRDLQESTGVKSVRGLSEITGEDWSYIARILKTFELPEVLRKYLEEHQQPEIVKYFNLRRLIELVHLEDAGSQMARFRELLNELE